MKTREEIIADIRRWYRMGGEEMPIQEDKVAKCVMFMCNIWTEYSQEALAGPNKYVVRVTDIGKYPLPHHVLLVSIYY